MDLSSINYKKIGLIAIFIVVVAIAGYFLYTFFFAPKAADINLNPPVSETPGAGLPQAGNGTNRPGTTPDNTGLPGSGMVGSGGTNQPGTTGQAGTPSELVSNQASFSFIGQSGQARFYNQADNRFYTLDAQGKLVSLANKQFYGVSNVVWANSGTKAIIEYPDGSKIRYDFATGNQVTLPKHWEDFAFSPAGDHISAKSMGLDPNNRWLIVANDDGSQSKQIEALGENADKVISSWSPNNQSIAFFVDGVDFNRKEVFFVGQNGENFKSTVTQGRGFQPLWSPKGDELLYSVYSDDNDYKPTLWLVGAQGDNIGTNRRPLGLDTWANKCSFGQGSLYCAVPVSLERGAGMFPSIGNTTQDVLYRIDPVTGNKELVQTDTTYSMTNLSVSADGNYVYFIDSSTGQLRKLKVR